MILINFSHPFTDEQRKQVEDTMLMPMTIVDVRCQLDVGEPFADQVMALVDEISLSANEWQTEPIAVNLPALSTAATLLLAELHGRMGYYPPVVRLKQVDGSVPPRWELAEILDINNQRNEARKRR